MLSGVKHPWSIGIHTVLKKRGFWEWLSGVLEPFADPWFCGRDFNEFLRDHKKSSGRDYSPNRHRFF